MSSYEHLGTVFQKNYKVYEKTILKNVIYLKDSKVYLLLYLSLRKKNILPYIIG